MRPISKLCIGLLFSLPFLGSCADDDIIKNNDYNIEEGLPVTASLKFGVAESQQVTRAAATETAERNVQNLFIIAFTSGGEISGNGSNTTDGSTASGKLYIRDVDNDTGRGTISNFRMLSGSGQTIYAIANIGTGYDRLQLTTLENFTGTREQFLQLTSTLAERNKVDVERGAFLMTGELSDVAIDERGQFLNPANNPTITLKRLEARITFSLKVDRTQHQDLQFVPSYYVVENISQGTYLFPHEKTTAQEGNTWDYTAGGYASMSEENVTKLFDDANNEDGTTSFEFYVWENRLTPKAQITQEAATTAGAENMYALREKRDKSEDTPDGRKPGQDYVLRDNFPYANDNSTYVVIYGTLTYTESDGRTVTANAAYTVHLGSTGNSTANGNEWYNNATLVNNYDTERNTHYTYNVTLSGVESMRVEVQEDDEDRPGVEGDVIVTNNTFVRDSHYGRAKFSLTRAAVKAGLSWSVSTPFQNGTKEFVEANYKINGSLGNETTLADVEALKTPISLNDYRWVQFVVNGETTRASDNKPVPSYYYAKYPGYEAYDGGTETQQAPAFGSSTGYHYNGATAYYAANVKMYDVNQLINHLYLEANKSDSKAFRDKDGDVSAAEDAEATITAFIDEYVYIYDPTKDYYKAPESTEDPADLLLWREVVNGSNRTLSISGEGTQYSPDGNTSWTETDITFSQHPIYTFYNPSAVETAWGTESEMETDKLVTTGGPNASSNSTSNGRENTLAIVPTRGMLRWSSVLYLEEDGYAHLQDSYNNIWYACLGRNRDLDGDDVVQEDEIRWYLASIDQLTDLWIGEAAIPNARLYDVDKNVNGQTVQIEHVASSSLFGRNNVWMIWAEEGASRGDVNRSIGTNGDTYNYRCVRNLGISLANIDEEPEDYVTLDQGTHTVWTQGDYGWQRQTFNEYIIDVSRLNNNTLRTATANQVLESHTERANLNRPASSFAVITNRRYSVGYNWDDDVQTERNNDPCPRGYRLPNQRELLLLTMYFGYNRPNASYTNLFDGDAGNIYVSKTNFGFVSYSYSGNKGSASGLYSTSRPGFGFEIASGDASNSTFLLLNNDNGNFYARCVRDVTD